MSLRFSVDALQMLIEFKLSADVFPSKSLMNIFSDLLPVHSKCNLPAFLSECAYEYFYSGKKGPAPAKSEFLEWVAKWVEDVQARILKVKLTREAPPCSAGSPQAVQSAAAERCFVVINSEEICKNSKAYKARQRLLQGIKDQQKEENPKIKRVRMSVSEDILKCEMKSPPEKKPAAELHAPPTAAVKEAKDTKQLTKSSLLSFITKKEDQKNPCHRKIALKPLGRFYGKVETIRKCKDINKPVKMVFCRIHGQIRPPLYMLKAQRDLSRVVHASRNSTHKVLPLEEYIYDSEEEWIEGEGESIDEESEESDDEESEDAEWVEKDTNEVFFTKGQLPRMDHPVFTVVEVSEESLSKDEQHVSFA
ncbi:uncharacterized protein NEMAJ01_0956 [Nematocida major]|uniref:uncharacterized protein n=1 Tax=Nematocida major TaxID=1912982 RepID=UPI0020074783|nr:uncharacterized protein NEMAJ01_0956 [Nematocida major]KAH9386060.1 hypothetical protein NEMAJ01_0956 [Nematocida major]